MGARFIWYTTTVMPAILWVGIQVVGRSGFPPEECGNDKLEGVSELPRRVYSQRATCRARRITAKRAMTLSRWSATSMLTRSLSPP